MRMDPSVTVRQKFMFRALTTVRRGFATAADVPKPSLYGQPLFQSHPHLVKDGELTPGFSSEEYEQRRRRLMDDLPEGSVVVSVAAPIKYMTTNIFYKYRQNSDFWYLTGFEEPSSAVIMEKNGTTRGYTMTLFSDISNSNIKWEGAKTPLNELSHIFHCDEARPSSAFPSHLAQVLSNMRQSSVLSNKQSPRLYVDSHSSKTLRRASALKNDETLLEYLSSSLFSEKNNLSKDSFTTVNFGKISVQALSPIVGKLRSIKSPAEQSIMRRAADISGRAHAKTMRFTEPGISESRIEAHYEYLCRREGAQRLAYVPVVASGANALIIHYTHNDHLINDKDMVLMDAACEYNGYASDITRTFPANGTFTPPQRELYEAVLTTQKSIVRLCSEKSNMSLWDLHTACVRQLERELDQIGFNINGRRHIVDELFPHFISHPIGMDLHESSHSNQNSPIRAGQVITIEPGLYVPPEPQYPKHFHNLAVRIEDEVLVGVDEPIVLTVTAPKEIVDVEGACQGSLGFQPF